MRRGFASVNAEAQRPHAPAPPSTARIAPVTNDALSLSSQAAASATSDGSPILPSGVVALMRSMMPGVCDSHASIISVRVPPGVMPLATAARYPSDPAVQGQIRELQRGSGDFVALWVARDVDPAPVITKTFDHPVVGPITVDCSVLDVADRDQRVFSIPRSRAVLPRRRSSCTPSSVPSGWMSRGSRAVVREARSQFDLLVNPLKSRQNGCGARARLRATHSVATWRSRG